MEWKAGSKKRITWADCKAFERCGNEGVGREIERHPIYEPSWPRQRLVTDAEVLQETLYRYVAIDRRDAIQPAFDALLGVVDQVLAVDGMVVQRAL
ncbi:MAG: hypothetical protein WB660_17440 [Candidatus Sulfotelmatobacter sp.]